MEKNRKWGYVFDEKLNMYVPNLPRQRKFAKVLLVLSAISFITASVQGFFLDKTSYEQISFLIYSIVAIFFFLSLYAVIKINIDAGVNAPENTNPYNTFPFRNRSLTKKDYSFPWYILLLSIGVLIFVFAIFILYIAYIEP